MLLELAFCRNACLVRGDEYFAANGCAKRTDFVDDAAGILDLFDAYFPKHNLLEIYELWNRFHSVHIDILERHHPVDGCEDEPRRMSLTSRTLCGRRRCRE